MLKRQLLRDQAASEIAKRIISGEIAPGQRLNEVQLATELGVSRTPIREALVRLEQTGILSGQASFGFSVVGFTRQDVVETYPMIAALEALACRESEPSHIGAIVDELDRIADEFAEATTDQERMQELDARWHSLLVSAYGNNRLTSHLASLKQIVSYFDTVYFFDVESSTISADQHLQIVQLLRNGDQHAASEVLENNWIHGMNRLLTWIDDNKQNKESSHE